MKNERAFFEQGHLVILNGASEARCSCGDTCYFLIRIQQIYGNA